MTLQCLSASVTVLSVVGTVVPVRILEGGFGSGYCGLVQVFMRASIWSCVLSYDIVAILR